jgi:hypothetical protein
MKGKSTILWLGLIAVAGGVLFETSYDVQSLEEKLEATTHKITIEQEAIQILKAEWSYLNDPTRLESLARTHLPGLVPAEARQFAALDTVPMRPAAAAHELRPATAPSAVAGLAAEPRLTTPVTPAPARAATVAPAAVTPANVTPANVTPVAAPAPAQPRVTPRAAPAPVAPSPMIVPVTMPVPTRVVPATVPVAVPVRAAPAAPAPRPTALAQNVPIPVSAPAAPTAIAQRPAPAPTHDAMAVLIARLGSVR